MKRIINYNEEKTWLHESHNKIITTMNSCEDKPEFITAVEMANNFAQMLNYKAKMFRKQIWVGGICNLRRTIKDRREFIREAHMILDEVNDLSISLLGVYQPESLGLMPQDNVPVVEGL